MKKIRLQILVLFLLTVIATTSFHPSRVQATGCAGAGGTVTPIPSQTPTTTPTVVPTTAPTITPTAVPTTAPTTAPGIIVPTPPAPKWCAVPPLASSTLAKYANNRGLNIGAMFDECFTTNSSDQVLCNNVVKTEYAGMMMTARETFKNIESSQCVYNFSGMDRSMAYAKANNLTLHDNLISNWTSYGPDWLFPGIVLNSNSLPITCGTRTKADLEAILKDYIQKIMGHNNGTITTWNVVNEIFKTDGTMYANCFQKIIGNDYIDKLFLWAREADPHAILVLNDWMWGWNGIGLAKTNGVIAYIKAAKARGVPIDGIGTQNHLMANLLSPDYVSNLNYLMDQAQTAGVKVYITEMDVYQGPPGAYPNPQANVANIYRQTVATCLAHSNCVSINTWGVSDKYSWLRWELPNINNLPADAKPLLFDDNFQKKPAYYGVMQALAEDSTRSCKTTQRGDINGDSKIDINDYNLFRSNYEKTGVPGFISSDINKSSKVDIFDYNVIVGNFGK